MPRQCMTPHGSLKSVDGLIRKPAHYCAGPRPSRGEATGTFGVASTMTSNRMPGLDFGLGETADMIRSAVESVVQAEVAPGAQ